ncbi:hypothetical protein J4429_04820 [Candidatus Pacearchaeota archaeon]|nr:hypothetical protein [Candidatus Pacearchaeota archaeon]
MTDIFDNKILCAKCNIKMELANFNKDGFVLKAVVCPKCNSKIIHPKDAQEYNEFINLRKKEFNVKMRFVGNSYAVSIPKEIVTFMKEQEKIMDDMVRLCFEEFGRISINFGNGNNHLNGNHVNNKINEIKKEKLN